MKGDKIMQCTRNKKLSVLSTNAGHYIGTVDEHGLPYCRVSEQYYPEKQSAEDALKSKSFTPRHSPENAFCAGTAGCVQGA